MKVKKARILLRLLCGTMALCLVAGCAGTGNTGTASKSGKSNTASQTVSVEKDGSSTKSENGSQLVIYPEYDERIERDYAYDVTVTQGNTTKALACYNHCDSVATSGRTVNGDMYRRFCEFAFDGDSVRVDVTVKTDFKSYTVMPSAKEFRSECHGNVISIYLDKADYCLLKLDDKDDSILTIFADEPEVDVPKKGDSNVLYISGWFEPLDSKKQLIIRDEGYTVYLAPGSVLNARVLVQAKNVTIKGRGMILDPVSDIYHSDASYYGNKDNGTRYLVNVKSDNFTLDGVKLVDSRDFNLFVNASNAKVSNMKVLSSEMCTDGITQAGGDNNTYTHCYIYNGDNGIVYAAGKNQVYNDITIGTICCGIFPQLVVGEATFDGLYIFRADEGLMRNLYNQTNPGTIEREFSTTINNCSCVDCDHFPFIFMGGNMGNKTKTITFNNLAVPVATGSNTLGKGNGATIQYNSASNYMKTTNYNLVFNGLSIGGKAVTSASELLTAGKAEDNKITVTGNGCTNMPATAKTNTVSSTAPAKIFIGNRQLLLKNGAIQKDKTWYVPAEDVCKALVCDVPKSAKTIDGVKYVSLKDLTDNKCTSFASYNEKAQAIYISAADREDNLLSWFGNSVHSHWAEATCYSTHLLYNDGVYYSKDSLNSTGAYYNLTQQLQQYGIGTYTLSIDLKADKDATALINFGVNGSSKRETTAVTTEWQHFTYTFSNNTEEITNAYLSVLTGTEKAGLAFRNATLTHAN